MARWLLVDCHMDIAIFPAAELPMALGAIRAVDPEPTAAKDRFIHAVARLHRMAIDPASLPAFGPAEIAAAITDPHRRKRLLQLAMVMATVDGTIAPVEAERVTALATALGVDEGNVRV